MRKSDKIQAKFSYLFEPAYSTIYYSFTFLILCVSIIISCEITSVAKSSIILGFIFLIFLFLPLTNKIYVQETSLWFHSLFMKDYGIYFEEIQTYQINKHKVIINGADKYFIGYMSVKNTQKLKNYLETKTASIEK